MNKKKILCILLALVAVISIGFALTAPAEPGIKVLLNGTELTFDVPAQIIDNRTMVPMRKIFEAMGALVEWNNDTRTVTATKNDTVVVMQVNNAVITVNGEAVTLDVSPLIVDNRTLVPARAVAESFDATVEWDGATKTVLITTSSDLSQITLPTTVFKGHNTVIDLSKETNFVANVGATITYGFDDMWTKTVETGYVPSVKTVDSVYRQQTFFISPLYANFTINSEGYAKVTYSVKRTDPNGEVAVLASDTVAIDGPATANQVIKSITTVEHAIQAEEPLGTYTFTVESKDEFGNKTTSNSFKVTVNDYKYTKSAMTSASDLSGFIYNYAKNPTPNRVIDAIIYAEKNNLLNNPVYLTAFIEILGKNPYLTEAANTAFGQEFGQTLPATVQNLMNTADTYQQAIQQNVPPTLTYIAMIDSVNNDAKVFGGCVGTYQASGSYRAAKVLAESLATNTFGDDALAAEKIPTFAGLVADDPLFKAYCTYMLQDATVSAAAKSKLAEILQ